MIIYKTTEYLKWFKELRDFNAKDKIVKRLARVEIGNLGDATPVGQGVSELRIHYGPGYRVYFTQRRGVVVILLCGGDKGTQDWDIQKAKKLAKEAWEQIL
ncbi:MAG TPA: addiction module antitoxin RelB [Rhodospirillaceae bacterium]|nr:addiction module antitoxin RelB [Rhodospirillaceae bacterium]